MKAAKLLCFATICFLCYVVCPLSFARTKDTTFVPLKEWKDYTNEEKDILLNNWTDEKVEAVLGWLKGGKNKPSFVKELSPYRYDLRGIPLKNLDLSEIDLGLTNLQGAWLDSINLQGTDLWRANLQGAKLENANLKEAYLVQVNLQEANLEGANLQRTHFWLAKLQGAKLEDANLQEADLGDANLQEANLEGANLQGANLNSTELRKANFRFTKLQDANLFGATFDSTYLWFVNLGEAKDIRYIEWGDRIENRYIISEEIQTDYNKSDENFRRAEITYRDLKNFYKKELMDDVAGEFHYRENHLITKRYLRTKSEPFYYLWGMFHRLFLEYTYGYGSRPIWLLRDSSIIIVVFFLIFAFLTIPRRTKSGIYLVQPGRRGEKERLLTFRKGRLFLDCFYFSLLSFVTFGYGALQPRQWLQFFRLQPLEFKPVRWARIFVGIEAALGIWIFALLVTVLFGKG